MRVSALAVTYRGLERKRTMLVRGTMKSFLLIKKGKIFRTAQWRLSYDVPLHDEEDKVNENFMTFPPASAARSAAGPAQW